MTALAVAGLLLAAWLVHPLALELAWAVGLRAAGRAAGVEISFDGMRAAVGRPWQIKNVRAEAINFSLKIQHLEIEWSPPWKIAGRNGRLWNSVSVRGVEAKVRTAGQEPATAAAGHQARRPSPLPWGWLAPANLSIEDMDALVVGDGWWIWVERLALDLREGQEGFMRAAWWEGELGSRRFSLRAPRARTHWRERGVYLWDCSLRPGVAIEALWMRPQKKGLSFELTMNVFGGQVRGGGRLSEEAGTAAVDVAFWAGGLEWSALASLLEWPQRGTGRLGHARAAFRGRLDAVWDGEASLRVETPEGQLGPLGWNRLELAASLASRRLHLARLVLDQGANQVRATGAVAVSGGWRDIAASPMSLRISARVEDLSRLAVISGGGESVMKGRMSLEAELRGRMPRPKGFVSMEASALQWRGLRADGARLEALLDNGEAKIELFEVSSGRDYLAGRGRVNLSAPHHYSGNLSARIANMRTYHDVLGIEAGRLELRWAGDGHAQAHSGAFQASVEELKTPWTRQGLTGRFAGTYSPESLHLSGCDLQQGPLLLSLRATLGSSGIHAEDVVLRSGQQRWAEAEFSWPVDATRLWRGESWAAAVLAERPLHTRLEIHKPVDLETFLALLGQPAPWQGRVAGKFAASGRPENPQAQGRIEITRLRPTGSDLPPATLTLEIAADEGILGVSGKLRPGRAAEAKLAARIPAFWHKDPNGTPRFFALQQPAEVEIAVPPLRLEWLAPLLPHLEGLSGTLSGSGSFRGSLAQPELRGEWRVAGAKLRVGKGPHAAIIQNLEATAIASGKEIRLASCRGNLSGGPSSLQAVVSLEEWPNWKARWDFQGSEILLYRGQEGRVRVNATIHAEGSPEEGTVSGEIKLVDGRFYRRLEVTPLPAAPEPAPGLKPWDFSPWLPAAIHEWKLDVRISNETPFLMAGGLAGGEIEPRLRLAGTLAQPVPEGVIEVRHARAFLPAATVEIPEGRLEFYLEDPWMPHLDIVGTAEVMNYEMELRALGRLADRMLKLRSTPELSREHLLLLLATGFAPGVFPEAAANEEATGQGSAPQLRQLSWETGLVEPRPDRLQITSAPPVLLGGEPSLRTRVKLGVGLAPDFGRAEGENSHASASYRFRFR